MPIVDVHFSLQGKEIPADHGYHLLSAVAKHIPFIHDNQDVGIHHISGLFTGSRTLILTSKSRLIIRLPSERIVNVLPLSGKILELNGSTINVGVPSPKALIPASRLFSRLVVIKGFMDPEPFIEAAKRQMTEAGLKAMPSLVEQQKVAGANEGNRYGTHSPFLRRTIRIRDKEIVGFALRVEGLTAEESILLQERGLGGRRRFGCGVFIPDRW